MRWQRDADEDEDGGRRLYWMVGAGWMNPLSNEGGDLALGICWPYGCAGC